MFSALSRLFARTQTRTKDRRRPLTRQCVRPCLERLEDRLAPAAGVLDPGFLPQGNFGQLGAIQATAINGAGRIVVAGSQLTSGMALCRYNADGSADSTFNGGQLVTNTVGSEARGVAVDGTGKILVPVSIPNSSSFALLRYSSSGVLDSTFDGDGIALATFSNYNSVAAVWCHEPGGLSLVRSAFQ